MRETLFDIIIDDASHVNTLTIKSFNILFGRIRQNGLYIIEDLGCGYFELEKDFNVSRTWPGMRYNNPECNFNNKKEDIQEFTNSIIEQLDMGENKMEVYSLSHYSFVHRYKFIMIIGKN